MSRPVSDKDILADGLARLAPRLAPGGSGIAGLVRLSGGASQETWAFSVTGTAEPVQLILRRAPGGFRQHDAAAGLATEAAVIAAAGGAGVPVPRVIHVLTPDDGLGLGFVTARVAGETIARKILRDAEFAPARKILARQCGEVLAAIHRVRTVTLPPLRRQDTRAQLDQLYARYKAMGIAKPVFELAFRWLADRCPPGPERPALVHGDFRNGNLIIGPDGIRAVLDWEVTHLGDPMEDLGWVCVNSWRFGELDRPAGGFGSREEMFAGYEAGGGGAVDPERVRFWEVMGCLRWGVSCSGMVATFRAGIDTTVERAMIARRSSETEIDLLALLLPRW